MTPTESDKGQDGSAISPGRAALDKADANMSRIVANFTRYLNEHPNTITGKIRSEIATAAEHGVDPWANVGDMSADDRDDFEASITRCIAMAAIGADVLATV